MAFGEILKNARLQRGLTPSDVAESTHLLVQVVEDLEREQFSRVAAPIYGRGFIKLYAELLELDPEPLIREFMDLYTGARVPAIRTRDVPHEAEQDAAETASAVTPRQAPEAGPQRQRIEPRPAVMVRPVKEAPESAAPPAEDADRVAVKSRTEETGAEREVRSARHGAHDLFGWVVRPEEEEKPERDVPQEPDLFHPAPSVTPRQPDAADAEKRKSADRFAVAQRRVLPIFKIGGRANDRAPGGFADEDSDAHARRNARIRAFKEGFMKLRTDVGRRLPVTLPHKSVLMLAGAGVVVLICLLAGISLLFRLTGSGVSEGPAPVFETVSPPPDLYID